MKNTLSIRGVNRALLFTIATVFIASILLVSCGGYGGGGGGAAPGTFMLLTPGDATTAESLTPTLTWTASTGATSYTVQVDQTGSFTGPFDINVSVGNMTAYIIPASTLAAGTTYHWRVIAYNYYGTLIAGPFTFVTP
jgi:hypothetical protein